VTTMCRLMNIPRDSYYRQPKREKAKIERNAKILSLVRPIRQIEPMVGCKKLHDRLKHKLDVMACSIGRDKFIEIMKEYNMLVVYRKRSTRTTYSNHSYAVAPNRIKNIRPVVANQIFVSDITYIRLIHGFAYLFLVTDLFSRKIVGYHLSNNLKHQSAISALQMALDPLKSSQEIIHHSDRGCQYCCHDFLAYLNDKQMIPSMTDESHCYQNAVAERVNGILKTEFFLDAVFPSAATALRAVISSISIYNNIRTHWSLGLKTPKEVYREAA